MLAPQGLADYYKPPKFKPPFHRHPIYKPPIHKPPIYKPPHKKPPILNKKSVSSCTKDPTRPCYPPRRPPPAEDNTHF
ncbi:hydroxyproline-rich glycoprotein [Trifolium medium]|uniref:Hydroxyproline-rich glycoprotein n=1 Tax=Trifolium medium TaxID=97028 RepID=A0A392LZI5_9FABA|nr:hydroxyproline-rich glycoprotein [Trifolium medium]